MNKSVLIEKRKNLLGNNKSTPELFLNSYFIDLIELFPKDELLNFVENQAITEIKINKLELTNKITTIINDANDEESLINAFNLLQANQFSGIKDKTKLIQMIINHKLDLIENLLEYALKSKLEYYDSSIWTLYCSYGLLEGPVRFINHDPLVLRAPLINLEIEIYKNEQAEIVFKKINEQLVSNDILEIFLDDQLEKFTLISEAINKDVFNANEYFEYFKKILPDLILEEDYVPIKKTSFESVTNAQSLKIHKSFFVSLISPVGGKMLRDYNDVLTSDYQFPVYDTIFHKNLNHLIYDNDEIYEINNPLNLVQKLAVINSQNKNTLIYGPPGTGKSEVVANLIANLLINNKNVVVISEKKAALDVLDSRLSSLNVLVMSTFDGQNNNAFYEKIIQLNHLLVGINKVNLKLNNQDYLNLLKYQNLFNSLVKYVDINGKNVYQILQTYDQINLDTYSKNIDLIKFICNKLSVEKITLSQLIKDVKLLKEIYTIYTNFFKEENISVNAYNYSRANEFLDTFNQVIDKERPYVITAFICEDKILKHKPLFRLRDKLIQTSDVEVLADTFRKIVNSKLKYIVNFQKIYNFVSSNNLASGYISLYDWLTNTELQKIIDFTTTNNSIQGLIRKYWNHHQLYANHTDEIIRDFYLNNLKDQLLANHEQESKWTELVRIANLNKKPNINKIVKEYYSVLRAVFPIWILSPNATAAIVPLKKHEFDYGIFDEASQLRIEKGLVLTYRCQFCIVSGDDKQLKPTSFFAHTTWLDETYDGHFDNVDSLLDKAKSSNWMNFTLNNHYRSVNEQLIKFSSYYFYNDELVCITKNGNFKSAVEVINEMGQYDREHGINTQEANRVIQTILAYHDIYKTIIVITFNIKQANYIQQLAYAQPKLSKRLEMLTLKIRSLESVQGDEGDLIIISCTFGKDKEGKFIQNFGPVNQDGGKNRINVMASRAKEKMIVIKSFMSNELTNVHNENSLIFKNFINYVEEANNTPTENLVEKMVSSSSDIDNVINELINELSLNQNLLVQKHKQIGTHMIDLAISKLNDPKIALCILIDGQYRNEIYEKDNKQWIHDIDRQKYYEDRGYRTYRLNVIEFKINHHNLINDIRQQIV